jgi:hypothetical protein
MLVAHLVCPEMMMVQTIFPEHLSTVFEIAKDFRVVDPCSKGWVFGSVDISFLRQCFAIVGGTFIWKEEFRLR